MGFKSDIVVKAPENLLEIKYNKDFIELGTKLKSSSIQTAPTVKFSQAKDDTFYTLVMVDFDSENKKATAQWVAVNIQAADIKKGTIPPDTIKYKAPDTTEKNVVFHVYEQKAKKQ